MINGTIIPLLKHDGLIFIPKSLPHSKSIEQAFVSATDLSNLHECLGHKNIRDIGKLLNIPTSNFLPCVPCLKSKSKRSVLDTSQSLAGTAKVPGEIWHTDAMGPMSTESINGGSKYLHMFLDDYSGCLCVYGIVRRSDLPQSTDNHYTSIQSIRTTHPIIDFNNELQTLTPVEPNPIPDEIVPENPPPEIPEHLAPGEHVPENPPEIPPENLVPPVPSRRHSIGTTSFNTKIK